MIKTVGDLLQALKQNEEQHIRSFMTIPHAPTIGAMYEGATKQLLNMAVFEGLGLTVSSGFIKNSGNEISRQIDCMVTVGAGTTIPNTDDHVFEVSDVIAIVEVKKNLYGRELEDAMDWSRDFQRRIMEPPESQRIDLLRDAWRGITGMELPERGKVPTLPYHLEMIYHALVEEFSSPLRIFIGYEGYANEYTFRKGLIDYLGGLIERGRQDLGGPRSLPDVMICRQASIFKLNGMPYPGPLREDGFWLYMGSRGIDPLHVLLEFLWTRLSYKFGLSSSIFGEDLVREGVNTLLMMKVMQQGDRQGWAYEYIEASEEELNEGILDEPWEPVEVSDIEGFVILTLGKKQTIREDDPDFVTFITSKGADPKDVIQSLCKKGLVCNQEGTIGYLTDECVVIFLPDGRAVAGENKSGRMTKWMLKHQAEGTFS